LGFITVEESALKMRTGTKLALAIFLVSCSSGRWRFLRVYAIWTAQLQPVDKYWSWFLCVTCFLKLFRIHLELFPDTQGVCFILQKYSWC